MKKTEIIFIPAPGIGHLVSTIEMAKLLISRDQTQTLSITILIMKLQRDTKIESYIQSISSTTKISVINLPSPDLSSLTTSPTTFFPRFIHAHQPQVRDTVAGIVNSGDCRVAGVVIDMFCTTMIDVAEEFGLPSYVFFTSSASFLSLSMHIQSIVDTENFDLMSLKEKDGELSVPGYVNPVPVRVLPSLFFDKGATEFFVSLARRFKETKGIIVNTFNELESYAIKSLENGENPRIYPVGPVLNLVNDGDSSKSEMIKWLDQQPKSSVVFLCFGSMGSFDKDQVTEIAKALEKSGYRFLWSLRKTFEKGTIDGPGEFSDPNEVLPDGFLERTKEVGKVVGWAPQVTVLSHQSIGGFVSHCGWNSTLESLWFGVPMATWPMYAEQQINAFQFLKEFGLAVEIKMDYKNDFLVKKDVDIVSADEIESGLKKLMEDGDGEFAVRNKVRMMSELSRKAVAESGSSYETIGRLIEDIIS